MVGSTKDEVRCARCAGGKWMGWSKEWKTIPRLFQQLENGRRSEMTLQHIFIMNQSFGANRTIIASTATTMLAAAKSAMITHCQHRRCRNTMTPNPVASAGGRLNIPNGARCEKREGVFSAPIHNTQSATPIVNTAQKYRNPRKARCLAVRHSAVRPPSFFTVTLVSMESSLSFRFLHFLSFCAKNICTAV